MTPLQNKEIERAAAKKEREAIGRNIRANVNMNLRPDTNKVAVKILRDLADQISRGEWSVE